MSSVREENKMDARADAHVRLPRVDLRNNPTEFWLLSTSGIEINPAA